MKRWYAVYTQPHKEMLAREHLERQGFDVFAPRYLKRRRHARRVEDVPASLFPRYIFVAFDVSEPSWRVIRSTRGVADLVRSGLDPVPLPFELLQEIKDRSGDDGYVALARSDQLKAGAKLRIESGPFAECEAIFQSLRDEDRVVVLLSVLGRIVKTQLSVDIMTPVG